MRQSRRLWRWLLGLVLVVGAVGLAILWWLDDVPRQQVEAALAERLDAEVRLDRLELVSVNEVRLGGLEVSWPDVPQLDGLEIGLLEAAGPLTGMIDGHFDSLRADELVLGLDVCKGAPRFAGNKDQGLLVDELVLEAARLELRCGDWSYPLELAGRFTGLGRDGIEGLARIGGGPARVELPADPGPAVATGAGGGAEARGSVSARRLDAEARVFTGADGPEIEMEIRVTGARVEGRSPGPEQGRALDLGSPELSLRTLRETADQWRIMIDPSVTLFDEAAAELELVGPPWQVEHVSARLVTSSIGQLLWLVGSRASVASGRLELELEGRPQDGLELEAELDHLIAQGLPVELEAVARAQGLIVLADGSPRAELELSADLRQPSDRDPGNVRDRLVAALLPAGIEARLEVGPSWAEVRRLVARSARLGTLELAGELGAGNEASVGLAWSWAGPGLGSLIEAAAIEMPSGLTLAGQVRAGGSVSGPLGPGTMPAAHAELIGNELWASVHRPGQLIETARLDVVDEARVELDLGPDGELDVEIVCPSVSLQAASFEPIGGSLEASARIMLGSGPDPAEWPAGISLEAGRARLDAGDLGKVEAQLGPRPGRVLTLVEVPDLAPWADVLGLLNEHSQHSLLEDAALSGAASAELTLQLGQGWQVEGALDLEAVGLATADSGRVMEDLSAQLELDASASGAAQEQLEARVSGRLGGFQALWDTVYADGSERFIELEAELTSSPSRWTADLGIELDEQLTIQARARGVPGSGSPVSWQLAAEAPDLQALWVRHVQEPTAGSLPLVDAIEMTGGAMDVHLGGRLALAAPGPGIEASLLGQASARGLGLIGAGGQVKVAGLDLDLPIDLVWSNGVIEPGAEAQGLLEVKQIQLGEIRLEDLRTRLDTAGDSLTLEQSLRLPLLGGQIELGALRLAGLLGADQYLETSIELQEIRLEELTRTLGWPLLEGRVDGRFQRLRLGRERLTVDGAGELQLLGGRVEVRDIAGLDPLSAYPRLIFSAAWSGIDLGQLTRTFDFGQISGVVDGRLDGCELFRGTPLRCSGSIYSVEAPGVSQRISLKAVNNIAIVGTGSGLGFIDRGIHRFIDSYPYDGIGVAMELDDDRFLLRGLRRRGELELFVKGRLPLRLDVVNVHPGTTVSFRAMLDRLGNLDLSGVRARPGPG